MWTQKNVADGYATPLLPELEPVVSKTYNANP